MLLYARTMGTTWVLHTETKGTGAQMVPLEKAQKRPSTSEPVFVPREHQRDAQQRTVPVEPRRFRIVNVLTRQRMLNSASIREALAVLRETRSLVDVTVFVWEKERERWRPLTFEEQRAMMDLAAEQTTLSAKATGPPAP